MRRFNPNKDYKCKVCKGGYKKQNPLQSVCSPKCAIVHAKRLEDKKQKEEQRQWLIRKRETKKQIEPIRNPLQRLQRKINTLVRIIDKGHPCISSGRLNGQMQAGHYWTVGANPNLRFHLINIWAQTSTDNNYKSGNLIGYKDGIINLFGIELFNEIHELRDNCQPIQLMKHEIEAKISIVNELIKELNKALETKEKFTTMERLEYRRLFNKRIGIYQ